MSATFLLVCFLGIIKPCTNLNPAPSTSTHLHPAYFNLQPAPSTSTQLISTSPQPSATPSTIFEPKFCTQLGNFYKFRQKNWKFSILTENWHTCYFGGADSESRLRFLKFRLQNPFMGKFGHTNSKLSISSKKWYIW